MRYIILALFPIMLLGSCVSNKKFNELDAKRASLQDLYEKSSSDLTRTQRDLLACQSENRQKDKDLEHLRAMNEKLTHNLGEMAMLTRKEAENLQRSLENIQEKDLQINALHQALTRKDSITIALVTSLKGAVGVDDEDITISVDKGVVFVSISDKFLFRSGSYQINSRAKEVLAKVAKVLESKPDLEVLIEGHTDNVSYRQGELLDNWDLSVKRATSLVRMLQTDFNIAPKRMTAAGRSQYVPVSDNTSAQGRSANRRTRIIIMPGIDQFFGMIEEELKK
ncbi:MAG: OmpA family protein [Flavobacteriales bacterium]|nr:OmpA family protein [Flavobacteriales bacterium]